MYYIMMYMYIYFVDTVVIVLVLLFKNIPQRASTSEMAQKCVALCCNSTLGGMGRAQSIVNSFGLVHFNYYDAKHIRPSAAV